jgi:dihydroflavonol-4-reductase
VYPSAVLGPGDPKATGQYIMNLICRRMPATVFNDAIFIFVHVKDVAEVIVRAAEKAGNIGEKYLAGNQQMTFGEINQMVSEISGVPLPRIRLPNSLTMLNAALLTGVANVLKKESLWGMSISQMKTMRAGVRADGTKAERELGISYTPVRVALEEAIGSFRR